MISVAKITMKSSDAPRAARFWRDLLGYRVAPNHSQSVLLVGDGPNLLIQPSVEDVGCGAIHLDLRPDNHDEAVAQVLTLGGRHAVIGQRGDEGWTVMEDATGTVFCILESAGTHAARLDRDPGDTDPHRLDVPLCRVAGLGEPRVSDRSCGSLGTASRMRHEHHASNP